ncbi:acyl-CoA carboxylase subunit epsilon [Corynebacterium sp. c8Ua_181]|uniref:Acyl-CoA carboxylase subunit epsilon n=1 Tax=Corynebacterium curieae TaxID=2913500 RepID=A0A9X3MAG8_9CORY|nr:MULTISPECIES: acyl-CoA carboxylase subunit epsilon [Corynebacterium]MCZ9307155.1 acyl-CoA carboxylase subunit epsilon [Corynebacterium curieae]MDV2423311.1 acyl-CoA carboxylase subunit epsilon [Corynebacterium curieae]MDV2432553.1 acyl-CoA carboxylase subunit epsilon [Corynebacterium tuberculostearicum]WKE60043.1 acyl-CoA carboxylase subunit epsilon [Corynebacterium tuberculostearicum]
MSAPEIKVVKGNPTEDELAALRTVLAQMSAKHSGATGERNEWGNPAERFERFGAQRVFNPSAFHTVRYF